jgi:hypothetical protein
VLVSGSVRWRSATGPRPTPSRKKVCFQIDVASWAEERLRSKRSEAIRARAIGFVLVFAAFAVSR